MSTILLDVDGVCADFQTEAIAALKMAFGKADVDETQWDFIGRLPADQKKHLTGLLKGSNFWRHLPVIPGAQEFAKKAREGGHDVVWVTSPWESCPKWGHARREWLKEHFGADPKNIIITARKELVVGDIFVDDKPANVDAWEAARDGVAVLFKQPYNEEQNRPRLDWSSENIDFLLMMAWRLGSDDLAANSEAAS